MTRFLARLWPPLGLALARRAVQEEELSDLERWQSILESSRLEIVEDAEHEIDEAEKLATAVLAAETKRKDTLESKAASFVVSPTVATGLVAALSPLTGALGLPSGTIGLVGLSYGLALIHLLVSAWYAVSARRAEGFVVLSAENAQRLVSMGKKERTENLLAFARQNEPALLVKSNRLSVAEELFLRGLAFVAVGAVVALAALVFVVEH